MVLDNNAIIPAGCGYAMGHLPEAVRFQGIGDLLTMDRIDLNDCTRFFVEQGANCVIARISAL